MDIIIMRKLIRNTLLRYIRLKFKDSNFFSINVKLKQKETLPTFCRNLSLGISTLKSKITQ